MNSMPQKQELDEISAVAELVENRLVWHEVVEFHGVIPKEGGKYNHVDVTTKCGKRMTFPVYSWLKPMVKLDHCCAECWWECQCPKCTKELEHASEMGDKDG